MTQADHLQSGAYFLETDEFRAAYDHQGKRVGDSAKAPLFLTEEQMYSAKHSDCICALKARTKEMVK